MPALRIGDLLLHVEERGTGDPLLLLHREHATAREWSPLLPLLPPGFRALASDARGHGASRPLPRDADFGIAQLSRDALGIAQTLVPGAPLHVAGAGLGGLVAQALAAEEPARVASLAVIGASPAPGEAFRAHHRRALRDLLATASPDPEARRVLEYLSTLPEDDVPGPLLRRYTGPALVVEAAEDALYSPVGTSFWRAWLPQARWERLDATLADLFETPEGRVHLGRLLSEHLSAARPEPGGQG